MKNELIKNESDASILCKIKYNGDSCKGYLIEIVNSFSCQDLNSKMFKCAKCHAAFKQPKH